MIRAVDIIRRCIQSALKPRPLQKVWQWIDEHVVIPMIVGSTNPGPLDTALVPPMRGLYELYWQSRVHYFTLAKSARVGGTLFSICCVLHKLANWPGPILWVDPTRKTALRFSRGEMQPHIMECDAVAEQAVISRTTWTALEMIFRACTLGLVGAGSAADLGGRQAEMLVLNERDKFKQDLRSEAPPAQLAIVRTKQFRHTRKILENSTPTLESADTWQNFLAGSQHYCYLPCPHCSGKTTEGWEAPQDYAPERSPQSYDPSLKGWQRLTFFPEEKEVPFADDGTPLKETRIEKTGSVRFDHCRLPNSDRYDLHRVEQEANYDCAHCGKRIEHSDLNWMLRRYWWRSHNAKAPTDHISAHFWAAYSPFEHWGQLAKKFLQSKGSISKMHDFYNGDLGLPFVRHATTIREDDLDRVIKHSPDYLTGQLPFRPDRLTMTVDVQGFGFWWSIRAWGVLWDHPDMPMWSGLVDCGSAVSWAQIEELAGISQQDDGTWNEYTFEGAKFRVTQGLIDSGYDAQQNKKVYDFCKKHRDIFNPSKGGSSQQMRGKFCTESPVADDQLTLWWYWDDHFKQALYYDRIKERRGNWWLPTNISSNYRAQLTAEHTEERKKPNGTIALEWIVSGEEGNHLGDTEKMHESLRDGIEAQFDELREERMAKDEEELTKNMDLQKPSLTS
jgi:hypothetical protein